MIFTTSYDKTVRRKTVGVLLIFTILPLFNILHNNGRLTWYLGFFGIFALILLYTFLHRPTQYKVDDKKIIIRRPIGNIELNIEDIIRVDRIHHDLLKYSENGGAFGYFGKFRTDLGKIRFYATRRDKLIMITTKDGDKVILTPDQEDEFVKDLEMKASSQQSSCCYAG